MTDLDEIPDDRPCYVDGFGQTTVGAVRQSMPPLPVSEEELTLRMWGSIVTHPKARPWKDPGLMRELRDGPLGRALDSRRSDRS